MAFAEIVDDYLAVQTVWTEKELPKQVPGCRWHIERKHWRFPLSWASCVGLRGVFGDRLEVGPKLNDWALNELRDRVQPANELRELLAPDGKWVGSNDHVKRLYPFQLVGREFLTLAGDALLADEMGTGKSVQTVTALRRVTELAGEPALPALIVCPNSVKAHWERHVTEWLPEATPYVIRGTPTQRRRLLAEAADDDSAVVIMNFEQMRLHSRLAPYGSVRLVRCRECDPVGGDERKKASGCEVHPKELNAMTFRTCVLDEAHRVKDPKAKQTRAIWQVLHAPGVRRRWALTGTPIANHAGDLWSTMHAVAPADFPVRGAFIDRYALVSWNSFGAAEVTGLNPSTRDELFKFLDPRLRRVTKSLVLPQLPPKTRITHTVEMEPKQRTAYEEMQAGLVSRLEDGSLLVARSSLVAQTRLLQLASSMCEIDRGDDPDDPAGWQVEPCTPSPKVNALVELLDDLGVRDESLGAERQSVAVAADQRRLLELASARLEREGIEHVMVTGSVPEAIRAANLQRFQAGEVPVLLFTYKAGGVGLDMTRANTLVRLQRSWSLVDNRQGEDRVHRIGSERHDTVTVIDVVTAGTIEEVQMFRLSQKLQRLEEITRDRDRLVAAGASTATLDDEEAQLLGAFLGEA